MPTFLIPELSGGTKPVVVASGLISSGTTGGDRKRLVLVNNQRPRWPISNRDHQVEHPRVAPHDIGASDSWCRRDTAQSRFWQQYHKVWALFNPSTFGFICCGRIIIIYEAIACKHIRESKDICLKAFAFCGRLDPSLPNRIVAHGILAARNQRNTGIAGPAIAALPKQTTIHVQN